MLTGKGAFCLRLSKKIIARKGAENTLVVRGQVSDGCCYLCFKLRGATVAAQSVLNGGQMVMKNSARQKWKTWFCAGILSVGMVSGMQSVEAAPMPQSDKVTVLSLGGVVPGNRAVA